MEPPLEKSMVVSDIVGFSDRFQQLRFFRFTFSLRFRSGFSPVILSFSFHGTRRFRLLRWFRFPSWVS